MRSRAVRTPVPAIAALVLALAAVPAATADEAGPSGLSILVYHPFPDPEVEPGKGGDPYGVRGAHHPSRDRMNDVYGSHSFPTVRVDGVLEHAHASSEDASSVDALAGAYRGLVEERLKGDAPVVITLDARVDDATGNLTATATFTPRVDVNAGRVALSLVVFEDHLHFDGGNGITDHRFTVRHVFQPDVATLRADTPVTVTRSVPVDANWTAENLGVVAFAQNEDPESAGWRHLEVLQSATLRLEDADAGPVTHAEKTPLLEMYSATWCPPCFFGDRAVEVLAEEYGAAGENAHASPWAYWRAPTLLEGGAGLLAALAIGAFVWPRSRGGDDA